MFTILSAMVSLTSFRFRRRASLELELLALRHEVAVLRRQRPGRISLHRGDRLLWAWLYRTWPRCLRAMVLVNPATVASGTGKASANTGVGAQDRGVSDGRA